LARQEMRNPAMRKPKVAMSATMEWGRRMKSIENKPAAEMSPPIGMMAAVCLAERWSRIGRLAVIPAPMVCPEMRRGKKEDGPGLGWME